jgi:hypothetical protein
MLNHRAGFTTHPSIDFLDHMTAGKRENNLPTFHSLAFHRLGYSGEQVSFLFCVVPMAAVLRVHSDTHSLGGQMMVFKLS